MIQTTTTHTLFCQKQFVHMGVCVFSGKNIYLILLFFKNVINMWTTIGMGRGIGRELEKKGGKGKEFKREGEWNGSRRGRE